MSVCEIVKSSVVVVQVRSYISIKVFVTGSMSAVVACGGNARRERGGGSSKAVKNVEKGHQKSVIFFRQIRKIVKICAHSSTHDAMVDFHLCSSL